MILLLIIILYFISKKIMINNSIMLNHPIKVECKKWQGDIKKSPINICKDCGYPIDCHGPYKGDSWRHIFKTE